MRLAPHIAHLALAILVATCMTLLAPAQQQPAEPDFAKVPEPPSAEELAARRAGLKTARSTTLRLAHLISASQGHRQRETHWSGTLPTTGFTIIPLQLYAGNDYYIILGSNSDADNITVTAFDPERLLIAAVSDSSPGKLVLRLKPKKSGPHYLRIHQKDAPTKRAHCALTYVYR